MKLKLSFRDTLWIALAIVFLIFGAWLFTILITFLVLSNLDEVSDEDAFINIDTRTKKE